MYNYSYIIGTPRRIKYSFKNLNISTEAPASGYDPPDCYIDWPPNNLMKSCNYQGCTKQAAKDYQAFSPQLSWEVRHCSNITEDEYEVQMAAWNPLDGWIQLDKPFRVEVLERVGPIQIDDLGIISDRNQVKDFIITFGKMGKKTCVTVDFADDSNTLYYGNAFSCRARFHWVLEALVTGVLLVAGLGLLAVPVYHLGEDQVGQMRDHL